MNWFEINGEDAFDGEIKVFEQCPRRRRETVAWGRRESRPHLRAYRTRRRMTQTQALTKTLVFHWMGNESLLHQARLECRQVSNEVLRLSYDGRDWNEFGDIVEEDADLVQNTVQCIISSR
ncbi:hypothetical protein GCM10009067_33980 [Haloarcula sebkhae]|uniref:Uncharacterized protein n=2 Tax=Haloarcula TaxID=2237 RepID=A0A830F2S7_9EURY|nr:hypothetical protein GCM10009067_33980 [Haloarcula sebkhae]